jgi:hypothetical protein
MWKNWRSSRPFQMQQEVSCRDVLFEMSQNGKAGASAHRGGQQEQDSSAALFKVSCRDVLFEMSQMWKSWRKRSSWRTTRTRQQRRPFQMQQVSCRDVLFEQLSKGRLETTQTYGM